MHIDISNLFQFVVPLTFLAIWALTSLFNREAPPLPQRDGAAAAARGTGRGDPPIRSLESRSESALGTAARLRPAWSSAGRRPAR